jgi:hypothetical protein
MQFTRDGATTALATWSGPLTEDGKFLSYGLSLGAPLISLANTSCTENGECSGDPFPIAANWIRLFVMKDPSFDIHKMSYQQYETVFRQSRNQYGSVVGTNDPDLTDFRQAGGKMITWHGLADELIPPNGTYHYYDRVLAADPKAADYYRFFPAPGVQHCIGGSGWYPGDALKSLIDWVEHGVAPEHLEAKTIPPPGGTVRSAKLCPYPKRMVYIGGNINDSSSFQCEG